MGIEKGKISGLQFMFLVTGFVQGSILLVAFTVSFTKQDTWLVILSALVLSIPFSISISLLAKRFAGMNLVQINDAVYGPYIGKLISALYVIHFFQDYTYNLRDIGDLYITFFMPDTPIVFFIIVFALICAAAVWKGIEVLARISHLLMAVACIIIIGTFVLLIGEMDFSKFLPVFELPVKKFIQGIHVTSVITFGETVVFLTIVAALNDTKHIVRNNLIGLIIGTVSLLIVTVRNTATLGITQTVLTSPSLQSVRLIDIGNIFSRMDILIGVGQTLLQFLKCSILYYGTIVSLSHLLKLGTYRPLVLPVGGIAVVYAMILFTSTVDHALAGQGLSAIVATPFMYVFPLLTLLIARIRNLPKQGKVRKG